MAQVQISVDTETKVLSVSINGTQIQDVEDVNVWTYRDSNGNVNALDVSVGITVQEQDGVRKRVSYYADGSEGAKRAIASGQKVYNNMTGFVGVDELSQAAKDIDKFLSSQKRAI